MLFSTMRNVVRFHRYLKRVLGSDNEYVFSIVSVSDIRQILYDCNLSAILKRSTVPQGPGDYVE